MNKACRKRLGRFRVEGPLAPFMQRYMECLADQGFSQVSFWKKTFLISEFSKWLNERKVSVSEITADHQCAFLRCRARSRCLLRGNPIALTGIMSWLKEQGVIPCDAERADQSATDRLLQEYSAYLQQERGLERTTIKQYLWCVRQFLQSQHGFRSLRLGALRAKQVCDFVRQYAPRGRTFSMGKNVTSALRSFLRFARYRGYIHADLAACVPAVPGWSMASIPRAMPLKVVRRVLEHSKRRRTPIGLRDRAILLLLARLGLRAREVVLLKLDDIDWRGACLRIQGKGRQERPLPMPVDVGEAIASYLRSGRQKTSSRQVFLCSRAPLRALDGPSAIDQILRRALARAGIDLAKKGTHQFRHALATELLRKGLSLTEIGQLLRHRSADATRRYAKVDLRALREVALPWPAGLP